MAQITKDFGDRAQGRVVDDNDFRLTRPARLVAGTVTGVFPQSPRHVTVTTDKGERLSIRVQA